MRRTSDQPDGGISPAPLTRDRVVETREVLTRELLVRAARVAPGERKALQFQALYLNLALVHEVTDGLGPRQAPDDRVEHDALEGLLLAVQRFDPARDPDFRAFAVPFVESAVADRLPALSVVRGPEPTSRTAEAPPALRVVPQPSLL